jgi:hypothetical protein
MLYYQFTMLKASSAREWLQCGSGSRSPSYRFSQEQLDGDALDEEQYGTILVVAFFSAPSVRREPGCGGSRPDGLHRSSSTQCDCAQQVATFITARKAAHFLANRKSAPYKKKRFAQAVGLTPVGPKPKQRPEVCARSDQVRGRRDRDLPALRQANAVTDPGQDPGVRQLPGAATLR